MATNNIIQGRPKAGPALGVLLSAVFALTMTAIATAEQWVVTEADFALGEPSPITVRVPPFRGLRDSDSQLSVGGGSIVVPRGTVIGVGEAQVIGSIYGNGASHTTTWAAYIGAFFLMALLYTGYLRRSSRGRLLRMQLVSMGLTVGLALTVKLLLLLTTASVFLVPVAAAAIVAAVAIDLYGGLATALIVGVSAAMVAPFDTGVVAVLVVQGVTTVLCIGDGRRNVVIAGAGLIGAFAAAIAYAVFYYLSQQDMPLHELADPLRSAWVATFLGGAASGLFAIAVLPVYQLLLGEITKNRLVELSDLSNPLLKQISEKSPGTWQHSLAMANMAEVAANAIGANGRLVRVGAYYHDLGKSLQPKYFIENLTTGESSPHDNLPPEVSCDAIFAHVTEGVRLARKEGLPERVIDFMHMHHGDGLLEYFWSKCQEQGNPQTLSEDDFRYPGVKPQTRETAILAVCDAVEAASRTLKQPDARAVENLVQRIVYGKLHLGQLDESGLSMSELRMISNSLIETIKHAHHVRVEYPWQREEREAEEREKAEEQLTAAASPRAQEKVAALTEGRATPFPRSATQRILNEPPLDSLDVPRAYWRSASRKRAAGGLGTAPTERVSTDENTGPTTEPDRPDTDPVAEAPSPGSGPTPAERGEPAETSEPPAAERRATVETAETVESAVAAAEPEPPATEPQPEPPATVETAAEPEPPATVETAAEPEPPATVETAAEPEPPDAEPDAELRAQAKTLQPDAELSVAAGVRRARPDADTDPPPTGDPHDRPTRPVEVQAESEPEPQAPPPRASQPLAATLPGSGIAPERPKPPPPPRRRAQRTTIELMKGETDDAPSPLAPVADSDSEPHVESHRAQSEDDSLEPGVMVVGPPPKTHTRPGTSAKNGDKP